MKDVVIVNAVRTAIGRFGGSLKPFEPTDLGKIIIQGLINRTGVEPSVVDKLFFGVAMSPLEPNVARNAGYLAGIPETSPGVSIHAACCSSIQAIISGVQAIQCGECDAVISGGVESMSNAPYLLPSLRWGARLQSPKTVDIVWEGMQNPFIGVGMGLTAENLAGKYNISRIEQDELALLSQQRALKAIEKGFFRQEIIPVQIPQKKGDPKIFDTDEHPRKTSLEDLSKLPPAFKKDGTVTAGNASGINDAASAALLMSMDRAKDLGLKPLARIKDYSSVGVDPNIMGIGPVPAIRKILKANKLSIDDIQRFEINEAFASQYIACERELKWDREKVNHYGSGIALGHPVGATGCRITTTLVHGLIRDDETIGIASLCAGGGMGFAVLVERIS